MNCAEAALEEMNKFGKGPNDVLWVSEAKYNFNRQACFGTWEEFCESFYGKQISEHSLLWNETLIIKGDGWWLELCSLECDEEFFAYWEYRTEPVKPVNCVPFFPPRN